MERKYQEVLFVGFAPPNTGYDNTHFELDVFDYFKKLNLFTKCHLRTPWAKGKAPNLHGHAIVLAPQDELKRFWKRYPRFKHSLAYPFEFFAEPFDLTRRKEAYEYMFSKDEHHPVMPTERHPEYFCPKYYSKCNKGGCIHIPSIL